MIHASRLVWQGYRRVEAIDMETALSAERAPTRLTYEIMRVGRIAAVLPYDPLRGVVLVIRQFRLGAHFAHGRGANIEVIAGRVEPGEDIANAARREAREEGEVDIWDLEPMLDFVPAPAALDENACLFLARADLSTVPTVSGAVSEQETVLPIAIRPETLLAAARAGDIRNGYTLLAIAWFMLHREEIDSRWRRQL